MVRQQCIFCKSPYHNYRRCPTAFKMMAQEQLKKHAKQEYQAESPNLFVGQYGYPRVNVGFLNVEEYTEHDEPLKWSRENKQIPEIVSLRSSLINSTFTQHIKSFNDRLLEMGREISIATKPAEMEISLTKKPNFKMSFNQEAKPHGPNVKLKHARITENVKVNKKVEKAVDDVDLKAGSALQGLYKKGIDEHRLMRAFSMGNFGVKAQRKLVPTRWSITAVDDTLGKQLIEEVKDFSESDCRIYIGGYLGNNYVILCYDDVWSYELFEGYLPKVQKEEAAWETDYENYYGRKEYASETAGGYYAARLAILERMKREHRQAAILVLRFITTEYDTPLGVWVVREAVRKAMAAKPKSFSDRKAMEAFAKRYCQQQFHYDITLRLKRSRLRHEIGTQTRLRKWF